MALVSGLSGAGRSTAAKVLEDLGWFVVDNLPPELIATMVDLGARARGEITRIAVVMDVRSRAFTADLAAVIKDLDARGYRPRLLFLEASDAVLVRRFEQVRRSHPLQGDGRLVDGIAAERALLGPLREAADLVVDTSTVAVPALRATLERAFGAARTAAPPGSRIVSFGFKYGLPMDADLVVDVRFLPNPHWIPELRDQTGRDERRCATTCCPRRAAREFVDRYLELLAPGRAAATGARASATSPSPSAAPAASTAASRSARRSARRLADSGRHDGAASPTATWGANEQRSIRPPSADGPLAAVALGGGHGLHATLSALRLLADRGSGPVTAVVTVADDGGSSGRLRRELGLLPPGDLRMALAALAGEHSPPALPGRPAPTHPGSPPAAPLRRHRRARRARRRATSCSPG